MGPPDLDAARGHRGRRGRARGRRRRRANIIFGTSVDETLGDQLWVTVIATGFERARGRERGEEPERSRDRSPLRELEIDDDLDVPSFLRD